MIHATIAYYRKFLSINNKWILFLSLYLPIFPLSHADALPPLIVATEIFNPPFIMQGANNQLFGFDIEMIEDLCRIIKRECQYHSGFLENTIISSIENHEADLGIASITITLERSQRVNFSFPYLPSYAQYLTLNKWAAVPFSKNVFSGKKIGIQMGTTFENAIHEFGFSNIQIIKYESTPKLINALSDGTVDFILQDALSAQYWSTQMPVFTTFGSPFLYGYGFGIAINKDDSDLLQQINQALLEYEKNGQFEKTYERYVPSGFGATISTVPGS